MSEVYKRSFSDGIAIGFGYLPVAMAFGITAKPLIDLLSTTLMSGLNYAGAGQFLTLQMLEDSSYIVIIIAIFITFLNYIPIAALGVLIFPGILYAVESPIEGILGGIFAAILGIFRVPLFFVVVLSVFFIYLLMFIM